MGAYRSWVVFERVEVEELFLVVPLGAPELGPGFDAPDIVGEGVFVGAVGWFLVWLRRGLRRMACTSGGASCHSAVLSARDGGWGFDARA